MINIVVQNKNIVASTRSRKLDVWPCIWKSIVAAARREEAELAMPLPSLLGRGLKRGMAEQVWVEGPRKHGDVRGRGTHWATAGLQWAHVHLGRRTGGHEAGNTPDLALFAALERSARAFVPASCAAIRLSSASPPACSIPARHRSPTQAAAAMPAAGQLPVPRPSPVEGLRRQAAPGRGGGSSRALQHLRHPSVKPL